MEPEVEALIDQVGKMEAFDPAPVRELAREAERRTEAAPRDALRIYKVLVFTYDRFPEIQQEIERFVYEQCSTLGWQLGEPDVYFDLRAARLYRGEGDLGDAALLFERAARALGLRQANGTAAPDDWRKRLEFLREARVCYEGAGMAEAAGRCYYAGMKLLRDHAPRRSRRLKEWFAFLLWGWGERPSFVVAWAAVWVLLCALGYWMAGVGGAVGSADVVPDCVYLSVMTFTTVGFGDITPVSSLGRLLAMVEAVSGTFFTGLFLVTFVKKFSR